MPQFVPKHKPYLEASWVPKEENRLVSKFWVSQECNQLWSVLCEHREIHNVLSVRRVTAEEDPLLHEGLFERISDRDPEGFPLTLPSLA